MTKDISKKNNVKSRRPLIIIIASLIVLAVIIWIGIAIPAAVTTGEENYTGAKLEAVKAALDNDLNSYSPALFHHDAKQHVESVVPLTEFKGKPTSTNLKCPTDTNNKDSYVVTIRRVWLFGSTYGIRDYNLCEINGFKYIQV